MLFRFRLFRFIFVALIFLLPFTSSAQNTPHTVNSYNALQNAITAANVALDADTINITADFTIAFDINTIFSEITINGNGHTINGADTHSAITTSGSHVNLTINNLTLAENEGAAGFHGGAINHQGGSLTLDNVTIRDSATSHATADGGGLICAGSNTSLTIRNSRIHDNSGPKGGGIYLGAGCTNAQITNSSIYDNESTGNGAGIHVDGGASVTISNSSIYGNTSGHRGGGIYMDGGGTLTLNHVTIAGNSTTDAQGSASSDTGAGLRMYSGTLNIRHSIIYGNTLKGNEENCRLHSAVTVGTLSNNMIGGGSDTTCTPNSDPADPQLVGPSVHGQGKFFIPRQGSQAIDSIGNADCLSSVTTDQRGQPRPNPPGGNCDKGAIEHPGYVPPAAPPPPPSNDGGVSGSGGGSGSGGSDGEAGVYSSESNAPPSTCETLPGDIEVKPMTESTQCQTVSGASISDPKVREEATAAVDVWSWVGRDTKVCFKGESGSIRFIDTGAMPRQTMNKETFIDGGMICAMIDGPGIVALAPGPAPAPAQAEDPPPAKEPAPAAAAPACTAEKQSNAPRADGSVVHIVQSGECLWTIANAYGLSFGDLARLNGLEWNGQTLPPIQPGQEIIVSAAAG